MHDELHCLGSDCVQAVAVRSTGQTSPPSNEDIFSTPSNAPELTSAEAWGPTTAQTTATPPPGVTYTTVSCPLLVSRVLADCLVGLYAVCPRGLPSCSSAGCKRATCPCLTAILLPCILCAVHLYCHACWGRQPSDNHKCRPRCPLLRPAACNTGKKAGGGACLFDLEGNACSFSLVDSAVTMLPARNCMP